MRKINLTSIRLDILRRAKKHIVLNGWNDKIFSLIAKEGKYKEKEIISFFPEGYKSLLKLYLYNADQEMIEACKKINFIRMRTSERVKRIILLRLKKNEKDKKLIKKTIFTLILPKHTKIATLGLYNTIDNIWYIAGDNSTDFNYYSKRAILISIYSATLFYWVNKNYTTLEQTKIFLNKQFKNVSKIPNLKERVKLIISLVPKIFSLAKSKR